jgi:iron uptake system EfeUOB component EfeO/EfeM
MKTKILILSLILIVSVVALSACSSKTDQKQQTNAGNTSAATQSEKKNSSIDDKAIKEGTAKLLATAKQLRKAATAGDEATVKELGPKLEQTWATFEDGVKPKYPDIYEQVEKNLNPAVAAAKASPIDKDDILKVDNQLIQVLFDLSGKLIPVDQIKAGTNQMLATTSELKKEIEAGNEAKVKELAPKLEDTWKTFEDGVPPRSADLYEKIEKSLNPEVAGSQKSPIDKQVLAQLNEGLTQALDELVKTIK